MVAACGTGRASVVMARAGVSLRPRRAWPSRLGLGRAGGWPSARPGCSLAGIRAGLGGPGRAWNGLVQRPELAGDVVVVAVAKAESDVVADVDFVQAAAAVDQAGSLSVASADFPAGFFLAP